MPPSHAFAAALLVPLLSLTPPAAAQKYPDRPIRIVVSQSAGGSIDIAARAIGQKLAEVLGQQVVVDNRPGANGIIATEAVVKSRPDGYTLLMSSPGPLTINPYAYKSVPYETLRDLAPITQTTSISFLMVVSAQSRWQSVADFLAEARAKPGELRYGSAGIGNQSHLAPELFAGATGTRYLHVPYRGEAPAIADLMGGQVQFMIGTMPALVQQVRAGKLRALAIGQPNRSSAVPDVPTMREAGHPAVEIMGWTGVLAPAGTPPEIVRTLHAEIVKILAQPDVREFLAKQGAEPVGSTPEAFAAFIRSEGQKWGKVIRDANITLSE